MGQLTNPLLQRLGRAQLWPRLGAVSARSSAYADQQFRSQYSSKLLCLLLTYGIIIPIAQPWLFLFRNNVQAKPNYSLRLPKIYNSSEDARELRQLYYEFGTWYEGRYVRFDDKSRRRQRYTGLHWGHVRILNIGDKQLYLLRGLTTTFAIGAEQEVAPVWRDTTPALDSLQDENYALAAWSRAVISNWDTARITPDVTLELITRKNINHNLDTRMWL